MESLSRLYRQLEKYETEIADVERDLADVEGQFVSFKTENKGMSEMKNKPTRDFHSYHQSQAYNDYYAYLKEKDRLERNIQNYKDILEERNEEKKQTEEKIREIITDSKTLQSVPLFKMASRKPLEKDPVKDTKYTLHPLQRLNAQGPYFRNQFMKRIEGLADVPGALHRKGVTLKERYPSGGRYRKAYTAKILKKRRLTRTCPKPTRYMAD